MRVLPAEAKTYREIAMQIAMEFGVTLPPMTFKRILGRQYLVRSASAMQRTSSKRTRPKRR